MSDDLLQRATKALREQGNAEPAVDRAAFMRARVVSQAKRSSKLRPQGLLQWAAVACLGFFATTAMAQVIAVQLPKLVEALRAELSEEVKPKMPARKAPPKAAKSAEPAAVNTAEPAAPSVSAEPVVPEVAAAPAPDSLVVPAQNEVRPRTAAGRAAAKRAWSSSSAKQLPPTAAEPVPAVPDAQQAASADPPATVEPASPEPQPTAAPLATTTAPTKTPAPESAELALFRRAQALHVAHDPQAIAAWDAFLRVASSSVLAPEARYNRALGLVRANRFTEARSALQPFADGKYGSYRKQEAQALLGRLPK